ncbi:phosphoadenosine phosphosulfate reductase family protein [Paraburkholderia hospita]|uniref:phosphoadenosine phosphosulfate reductase domain-containing protein n=1 Tax=Paraburkholderia hospita TaxID=169430 RepID=UPI003ECCFD6B
MDRDIHTLMENAIASMQSYIEQGHVLAAGVSGGKDSTCAMVLMLEAVRRAKQVAPDVRHYITSSDTTIENPSTANFLHAMLDEVAMFVEDSGLPVEIHITKPSLASQFVVSTIGRGTLVRTPENGVRDGKRMRACADSWKLQPQGRLRARLEKEASSARVKEIINVVGTRLDESAVRRVAMTERNEQAEVATRQASGSLSLSPLKDWTSDDVWSMLGCMADSSLGFSSPLEPATIARLSEIYRAGNGGVCGVVAGESGARAACGSRFGCSFCGVTGARDKSMEFMIQEPEHAHLKPLNDFRNYLLAIQWDLSRRELVGRTLSDAGYTRIQADTYRFLERMAMLKMLLSIDANERDRAERHSGELASGLIADTEHNLTLCDPQFEFVTPQQLVAIDFFLSMHHYAPHAFPGMAAWHDVNVLGRRYPVPHVEPRPKADIVLHGWYPVGQYDREAPSVGLRDADAEQWNRYRHPGRAGWYARTSAGEQTVYFEEASQFEVDAEAACEFVTCTYDTAFMLKTQHHDAMDSARFWLNEGFVRLPVGMAQRYQEMAKRGQYFNRLAQRLNLTPDELDSHLIKHSVSDAAHTAMLKPVSPQFDLFAAAA